MKKYIKSLFVLAAMLTIALISTQGAPNTAGAITYDKIPLSKIHSTSPFTDIGGNIHSEHIKWAYQYGITKGSPEGSNTYRPLDTVNRGSMASFLRRIIGTPDTTKSVPYFSDIQYNLHETNIKWLASEKITQGSPQGSDTYKPLDAVNRGAMATFMYRLAGEPKYTAPSKSSFIDVDKSNIHYKAINWLKSVGLTEGSPAKSNTYKPFDTVNRGSMATFLHRLYDYLLKNKNAEGKCSNPKYVNKAACVSGGGSWTPTPNPAPTPTPTPTPTKTYTVTFNANGGTGTTKAVSCTTTKTSCAVKLAKNAFTPPTNNTFDTWNTKKDGSGTSYSEEQSGVVLKANMTLYASWNAPFTITFKTTTPDEEILLPVSSCIDECAASKDYNWSIDWDYGSSSSVITTATGSSTQNAGIPHTYPTAGLHKILIRPVADTPGWFRAFGFSIGSSASNADANKEKVTQISGTITKYMLNLTGETTLAYAFMFYALDNPAFQMAADFNIDQNITGGVGDGFAMAMFRGCSGDAFNMAPGFNLPQGITAVGVSFLQAMFMDCSGSSFNMAPGFTLPQSITTVDNYFVYQLFESCYGDAFNMAPGFNLPRKIVGEVGSYFAGDMFSGCHGNAFTMAPGFNLPQGITKVSKDFVHDMFSYCYGDAFNMAPGFNLPQSITTVDDRFVVNMFAYCYGNAFTMSNGFTFPQNITTASANDFARAMFQECYGNAFNMAPGFNLPQKISGVVGSGFARYMFQNCSGNAFNMASGFNIPQGITECGDMFLGYMFQNCSGNAFTVKVSFKFPRLNDGQENIMNIFFETFKGVTKQQTVNATTIININPTPEDTSIKHETFPSAFPDYASLNPVWKA